MALRTIDVLESRIWDPGRDFLLLCKCKQPVALDADDECRLLYLCEGVGDGVVWRCRGGDPVAGDVVGVEFAGYGYVAVAVEAFDEFLTLVAEVGLGGEVSGCASCGGHRSR